ncbi:hypothetical protein CS542_07290 [Pedobacter sp. IW39]|nr:hypothetical protein CS542_07290 [Pedobacter sp. IW39]
MTQACDLNEGLESTLVLLRSTVPPYIKIVKDLTNPTGECSAWQDKPGFMNLITNALHALKVKIRAEESIFDITTSSVADHVISSIGYRI